VTERNELGATEALMDLIFFALDHGISSVEGGGPLIPFVVFEQGGTRHLHRFVTESLDAGRAKALEFAASLPPDAERYAVAVDGYIRVDAGRQDAIIVEGAERGMEEGLVFAQRYEPKRLLRKARPVGNPAYIGNSENLLRRNSGA
jgi:hypothetical protein